MPKNATQPIMPSSEQDAIRRAAKQRRRPRTATFAQGDTYRRPCRTSQHLQKQQLHEQILEAFQNPKIGKLALESLEAKAVMIFFVEIGKLNKQKGWFKQASVLTRTRLLFSSLSEADKKRVSFGISLAATALQKVLTPPSAKPLTAAA